MKTEVSILQTVLHRHITKPRGQTVILKLTYSNARSYPHNMESKVRDIVQVAPEFSYLVVKDI